MNLVAKIRSLQAQVDELRARLAELASVAPEPLTPPIAVAEPIASATIAPPPAKRRGRPPKPKV